MVQTKKLDKKLFTLKVTIILVFTLKINLIFGIREVRTSNTFEELLYDHLEFVKMTVNR